MQGRGERKRKVEESPMIQHEFAVTLLRWFARNGRSLPWRETKDPYAIWLSEVILQQTRIAQGMAYWERFMQTFPTVDDLAVASEDEVLRLWQGLGYYSRARNLHKAAKQIVEKGRFPDTMDEIRQLKGVGDYTAAAIGSIAFGLPAAAVDGNIYRVLSRYFGISTPINSTEGKKEFAALAQSLLPVDAASEFNQALMDFGAIQCVSSSATLRKEKVKDTETRMPLSVALKNCEICPLQIGCVAYREGRVGELPVKLKTVKVKTRYLAYIYMRCGDEVAIRRRPSGDIWEGLWEPYLIEQASSKQLTSIDMAHLWNDAQGKNIPAPVLLRPGVKHVLTHRIILSDFYLLDLDHKPALPAGYIWVREDDLDRYAVPRLIELLLEEIGR